ncbi:MAG: hypothetical protein J0L61_03905 [Planctomycetes bacterium]|nr:hypothetical protein [Planctomycetota bacterium]
MDRLRLNTGGTRRQGKNGGDGAHQSAARPTETAGPLPFPRGGVFGLTAAPVMEQIEDALSVARSIESTLDKMQRHLDELQAELDEPFVFPLMREDNPEDTRPLAA